jgi:hypothetical protein
MCSFIPCLPIEAFGECGRNEAMLGWRDGLWGREWEGESEVCAGLIFGRFSLHSYWHSWPSTFSTVQQFVITQQGNVHQSRIRCVENCSVFAPASSESGREGRGKIRKRGILFSPRIHAIIHLFSQQINRFVRKIIVITFWQDSERNKFTKHKKIQPLQLNDFQSSDFFIEKMLKSKLLSLNWSRVLWTSRAQHINKRSFLILIKTKTEIFFCFFWSIFES